MIGVVLKDFCIPVSKNVSQKEIEFICDEIHKILIYSTVSKEMAIKFNKFKDENSEDV